MPRSVRPSSASVARVERDDALDRSRCRDPFRPLWHSRPSQKSKGPDELIVGVVLQELAGAGSCYVRLEYRRQMEVAVVGLPHEKWGEAPQAFIVCKPGATLDEEELRGFARSRLAGFKVPKGVTLLAELPKTATGKIQKFVLRGGKAGIAAQ